MLTLRKREDRGHIRHDCIDSYHTFSFSHYFDPAFTGFRRLKVLNEDLFPPSCPGYDKHPHKNMELLVLVLEGELRHFDSIDGEMVLPAGTVRWMSAGRGISHAESNASDELPCRMMEVWFDPTLNDLEPRAQTLRIPSFTGENRTTLIASSDGRDGSLPIGQELRVQVIDLVDGGKSRHFPEPGHGTWFQQLSGEVQINQRRLRPGDGLAAERISRIEITALSDARLMLFDLP